MLPSVNEIAIRRKKLGLTQKRLADMAGVSQSLIAKIEAGRIDPAYTKIKAIFAALEQQETRKDFRAKEILQRKVISVQKDAPVSDAVRVMMKHGYSQLPVCDGEHPVGSISEKTISSQVLSGKELNELSAIPIRDVMDEAFPQVDEDAPLSLISGLLQVYPAVLVSKKGAAIGILTKADLLKILLR